MFLRDENSPGVASLTDCGLFSLVTPTVSSSVIIVAEGDTDAGKVPLRVEALLVPVRADCGVLTLVNISAGQTVSSQLEPALTADEAARGVEARLSLLTARALTRLTLVNISAGLLISSQLVPRQAAPPAPHCVDTNLLLAAGVDVRAALVNIPALLALTQVLVARLAG